MITISKDTICARSTASGAGAIAVIRVSGSEAIRLTSSLFSKSLKDVVSHSAHFGIMKNVNDDVLDEVLVTVFHEGKSFTGEATTEIACHGSSYIQQEILKALLEVGCRMAEPGEFTMRAFFNGKMDLSQAEAIADLIAADSAKIHQIALNQMRGGYSYSIKALKQQLMDFASLIELELDFSEEDVEFASRDELATLVAALKVKLKQLTDSFSYGNALKNGINTVIAGRPNAGKSTLLNALLNEERAIVSDIAGTTRDTIEETLTIDGMLFRFIDTAGIREATDEIERLGVERTFAEVKRSKIVLYIYDASVLTKDEVLNDLENLTTEGVEVLILANKVDQLTTPYTDVYDHPVVKLSAKNKSGLDALKEALVQLVEKDNSESDMIVVNARHYEAFSSAYKDLLKVEEGIQLQLPGDLLAMDIRSAIRNLASITGEISTDDLLGNIFANFCIGK